jgi:hypothetical protein
VFTAHLQIATQPFRDSPILKLCVHCFGGAKTQLLRYGIFRVVGWLKPQQAELPNDL